MNRMHPRAGGFSLIEVLVALVIIGVGMMGIAKIQALAYASTGTASSRSLAAIEAASLATAMRANRNYWSVAPVPLTLTLNGTALTSTDATLLNTYVCTSGGANAPCSGNQLAAYDLKNWVTAVNALLPAVTGTISCTQPVATVPIGCTIQLSWTERQIALGKAVNTGTAVNNAAMTAPTYTLYVEP
jgi:type IV pilus assembly protein PilV